jgi:hypothetical protein
VIFDPVFWGLRPAKPYESLPGTPFLFNAGTATFEAVFWGLRPAKPYESLPGTPFLFNAGTATFEADKSASVQEF